MSTPSSTKRKLDNISPDTSANSPISKRTNFTESLIFPPTQSTPIRSHPLESSISSFVDQEISNINTVNPIVMSMDEHDSSSNIPDGDTVIAPSDANNFIRNFTAALTDQNVQTVLRGLIKAVLNEQAEQITQLETKVCDLEARVATLESGGIGESVPAQMAIPQVEQTVPERSRNLVIRGISDVNNDAALVNRLIHEELELLIPPNALLATRRFGRGTEFIPRPLMVTFANVSVRNLAYKSRMKLRAKGPKVFLHEDLDPQQAELAYHARTAVRNGSIKRSWTDDGRIYIVKEDGEAPIIVTNREQLSPPETT